MLQIFSLEEQNKNNTADIMKYESDLANLKHENSMLIQNNEDVMSQNEKMKQELSKLESEHEYCTMKLKDFLETYITTNQELKEFVSAEN